MPLSVEDRFWAKVDKNGPNGCWEWTAGINHRGYGYFGINGRNKFTHRVTYEWLVGPIPEGLQIDHLCRNRLCCNPEHLEPVTAAENSRRGKRAQATHCVNGHEYTPENTYVTTRASGYKGRGCWKCHAENVKTDAHGLHPAGRRNLLVLLDAGWWTPVGAGQAACARALERRGYVERDPKKGPPAYHLTNEGREIARAIREESQ